MIKARVKFTIFLLIALAEFFCFGGKFHDSARADSIPTVVINEIAWMGTLASANDEWMELYNNTDAPVDLNGWKLVAIDGSPLIELSGQIAPHDYYLLERTSDETIKDIAADLIYVGSLSNSGEKLELRNADGNIVDVVDCAAGWHAGDNTSKASMERISFFAADSKDNWAANNELEICGQDSKNNNIIGTPRAKNSAAKDEQPLADSSQENATSEQTEAPAENNNEAENPAPIIFTASPGDLAINEFLSDPAKGGNEWVEIYNNTNKDVSLDDWTIEEGSGAKTILAGIIPANGFFTVNSVSGNLNNDGDIIALKDRDGRIIDSVAYGK
jgi:hypothetical protein